MRQSQIKILNSGFVFCELTSPDAVAQARHVAVSLTEVDPLLWHAGRGTGLLLRVSYRGSGRPPAIVSSPIWIAASIRCPTLVASVSFAHFLGRSEEETWFDPEIHEKEALRKLLQPRPGEWLNAAEVSTLVNSPENNSPAVLEPVATTTLPVALCRASTSLNFSPDRFERHTSTRLAVPERASQLPHVTGL